MSGAEEHQAECHLDIGSDTTPNPLPEIQDCWIEASLGSICKAVGGGTPSRSNPAYWDGDIPWASVKDFGENSIYLNDTQEHISHNGLLESASRLISSNTTLICTRMAVGRCSLTMRPTAINQDVKALIPHGEIVPEFLVRLLSLYSATLDRVAIGSTVKGISTEQLLALCVSYPEQAQQIRILEILRTLDTAIEKSEALITKLKQVRVGMLHDLLTCGVDESGEIRDPHQHPKQFDNSTLGIIPKEWQVLPIGSACLSAIDGPFGSNLKSSHYIEGNGIRVVRLQNIGIGDFLDDDKAFISHEHAKSLHRHKVVAGDLLVASLGDENHPIARACVYPEGLGDAINKADCFRVRMNPSMAINEFTGMLLNCPATRKGFFGLAQGVTRDRINLGNLKSLLLALPPVSEQKLIVKYYGALSMDLEHQISAQSKLKTLKQGLTADLLTGQVRVPPNLELI